jgi:hypothetical protein
MRRAAVTGAVTLAATLATVIGARSTARAQRGEVAWYRVVNVGATSGTMARFQRVGEGYAGTFPFMDGFEVNIRPDGSTVNVVVTDGPSRVTATVSCAGSNAPRRASLLATRTARDSARISIEVVCSAAEPPAR